MNGKFALEVVTKPTVLPVYLTPDDGPGSIKAWLRIRGRDAEDEELRQLVKDATEQIENLTMHTATPTTYRMTLDRFPMYYGTQLWPYDFQSSQFKLPRYPVKTVTDISYTDVQGVDYVLDPANYQVANARCPGRVIPTKGQVWPFTDPFRLQSVRVTFSAGYGVSSSTNPDDVPAAYKLAVKYLVTNMYYGDRSKYDPMFYRCINQLKLAGFTQWSQ